MELMFDIRYDELFETSNQEIYHKHLLEVHGSEESGKWAVAAKDLFTVLGLAGIFKLKIRLDTEITELYVSVSTHHTAFDVLSMVTSAVLSGSTYIVDGVPQWPSNYYWYTGIDIADSVITVSCE